MPYGRKRKRLEEKAQTYIVKTIWITPIVILTILIIFKFYKLEQIQKQVIIINNMNNLNFRYYNAKHLVVFVLFAGTLINLILSKILPVVGSTFNYYQFPTTGLIVILLLVLINRYFWKHRLFSWLVNIPNLQGRYEGALHFIHPENGEKSSLKCTMTIHQTASKIVVNTFFITEDGDKSSRSTSKVANIVKNEDETFLLIFTYENKGSDIFPPHYGTNVLQFIENDKVLNGTYYTNRIPQTKGHIGVQYVSDELHQEF